MSNMSFKARLQKSPNKGGWTYVVWPSSVKVFGTGGAVKVQGTANGHPFQSCFMPMGDGNHMLPIKAVLRNAIGKDVGDIITVVISERLN
jgi:hypothetical protein